MGVTLMNLADDVTIVAVARGDEPDDADDEEIVPGDDGVINEGVEAE